MATATLFSQLCSTKVLLEAWTAVKSKGAAGGIDGKTVAEVEGNVGQLLRQLSDELRTDKWVPQPYLRVDIPKKNNEKRHLGLLTVKDKIVQQAILLLLQPRFDRLFVNNSYGYRTGKGPVRAVHRAASYCACKRYGWVLRLDIDNFFDTVDHTVLFDRLAKYIPDADVLRLVQLCVSMGTVNRKAGWRDSPLGLPQGAPLSPLLSNFYLHPFDQFVLSKTEAYVRYADDLVVCCDTREAADDLLAKAVAFLDTRLHLKLNTPVVVESSSHFEFLGIDICRLQLGLTPKKEQDLLQRIDMLTLGDDGLLQPEGLLTVAGIGNYYGRLLDQPALERLDQALVERLCMLASSGHASLTQKKLQQWLPSIKFMSEKYILNAKGYRRQVTEALKRTGDERRVTKNKTLNQRIVNQRKVEYHRKEAAGSELIVNTMGAYLGSSQGNIVVRCKKEVFASCHIASLRHISILTHGVSISSNAIDLCMEHHVAIDFFDVHGKHRASVLSPRSTDLTRLAAQQLLSQSDRFSLAQRILMGKVKNQANLVKYFNKYHAKALPGLQPVGQQTTEKLGALARKIQEAMPADNYQEQLMAIEAQAAVVYWDYVRQLIADDNVDFRQRVHQGATDLVNSMLNYGYALLYSRVWQALLAARLNPYDSVVHVRQAGKPTFVYDVVELFRAQTVDRIVISLIQKHQPLTLDADGRLSAETRALLAKSILERFNRYEKYRGEEMRFEQVIHRQAEEIAEFITNHKTFRPYLAKW